MARAAHRPVADTTAHYVEVLSRVRPAEALRQLREEGDMKITIESLYQLNKRYGHSRWNVDASETVPWPLLDRHLSFGIAIKLRDLARKRQGLPLSDDPVKATRKARALANLIVELREADLVIDYNPVDGFIRVPRRYIEIAAGVSVPLDEGFVKDPTKADKE